MSDIRRLGIKFSALCVVYTVGISIVSSWFPLVATNEFWPYFIGIAVTYQCISMLFELWIVSNHKYVFGLLGKKARVMYPSISDFAIATNNEFTSLIHSTISGLWALSLLMSPTNPINQDHLFGSSFQTSLHSIHSSALFFAEFLDLLIRPRSIKTYEAIILVHHVLASLGFFTGAFGIGTYYSVCILLSEISTMFLDTRWFALRFDRQILCRWAENGFVAMFLVIRVGFTWFYFTPIVFRDLVPIALYRSIDPSRFPLYNPSVHEGLLDYIQAISLMVCILLGVFHLLNLFFLSQIYGMMTKSKVAYEVEIEVCPNVSEDQDQERRPLLSN